MLNLKVAQLQCKPTYHMLCIQIQENRNTQLSLSFGYDRSLLLRFGCPQFLRLGVFSSCGRQASHCYGFSCCGVRPQARGLQQLQHAGSVVVAHGLSCFMACGGSFRKQAESFEPQQCHPHRSIVIWEEEGLLGSYSNHLNIPVLSGT